MSGAVGAGGKPDPPPPTGRLSDPASASSSQRGHRSVFEEINCLREGADSFQTLLQTPTGRGALTSQTLQAGAKIQRAGVVFEAGVRVKENLCKSAC